jgi:ribosomal protein S18 acetylase RimI-like enzyme
LEVFVTKRSEDLDRYELVEFMKTRSETDNSLFSSHDLVKKYVDTLLDSMVKHNILAYVNDDLFGWLGLIEVNPSLMILFEWHPFVFPSKSGNQLARNLLKEAFQFTKNKGISNVRVFVDVSKQKEKDFQELKELYGSVKMTKTHVHYCMEHTIAKTDLLVMQIPPDMAITSLENQNKDKLLECYHRIFENSLDDYINSLDEEERSYWDFFNLGKDSEASVFLEHNGEVIGFVGARDYGSVIEFGPIGILPEYRGRGLSKILMNQCISNLIRMNKKNAYLEVGERNLTAVNLYSKFGFKVVSKKHGFLIRLK